MTQYVKKFSYSENKTPKKYKCAVCGAKGLRLFRESNVFACDVSLTCLSCVCKKLGIDKSADVKERIEMKRHVGFGYDNATSFGDGSYVAAVPDEDGRSFWTHHSIPSTGLIWWFSLPEDKAGNFSPIIEGEIELHQSRSIGQERLYVEIICRPRDLDYCWTIAVFRADDEAHINLEFVGDRPFDKRVDWELFKNLCQIGQRLAERLYSAQSAE